MRIALSALLLPPSLAAPVASSVLLAALAPGAAAQSSWVRVDVAGVQDAAPRLSLEGFVVVDEDPGGAWLDVILPDVDLPRLRSYGYPLAVLQHSVPLKDLQGPDAVDPNFYDYDEIAAKLLDYESRYPALARRVDVTALAGAPLTWEGRRIYALKVSDNVAQDEDELAVLFVGNHHAREISTPVAIFDLCDRLLQGYGSNGEITGWVNGMEIWLAPTWNPDGLEYVWNFDQWWRKNRRDNGGGIYGVDLNRNYPFDWAVCGNYSHSPSSDVYAGPYAASEPETQTMLGLARARRFAKVVDDHTYGREVLYPYACSSMPPQASGKVIELRNELAAAASYSYRLASAGGEHFEWEFNEIGAVSYLFELDTDFFPSWSQALAEAARVWPSMQVMLRKPIPLAGHVFDAWSGSGIADAGVAASGVNWSRNEQRRSGPFGRYHYWIDEGTYTFTFSHSPAHFSSAFAATLPAAGLVRDVFLNPADRPYLVLEGTPSAGQQIRFRIQNAGAWNGSSFVVYLSRTGGGPFVNGFTISGGLTVPLVYDNVTAWGEAHASALTGGISGGTGTTPWGRVPAQGAGLHVWAAGVVFRGSANQIVSPAMDFQVQ